MKTYKVSNFSTTFNSTISVTPKHKYSTTNMKVVSHIEEEGSRYTLYVEMHFNSNIIKSTCDISKIIESGNENDFHHIITAIFDKAGLYDSEGRPAVSFSTNHNGISITNYLAKARTRIKANRRRIIKKSAGDYNIIMTKEFKSKLLSKAANSVAHAKRELAKLEAHLKATEFALTNENAIINEIIKKATADDVTMSDHSIADALGYIKTEEYIEKYNELIAGTKADGSYPYGIHIDKELIDLTMMTEIKKCKVLHNNIKKVHT